MGILRIAMTRSTSSSMQTAARGRGAQLVRMALVEFQRRLLFSLSKIAQVASDPTLPS